MRAIRGSATVKLMMNHWISQLPPQGVWIGIGLLVAAGVSVLLAARLRLGRLDTLSLFSACVLAGGVGSRMAWALLSPTVAMREFLSNPLIIFDPLRGGYSSFGAMWGGCFVLGVWWVLSQRAANKSESSSDTLNDSRHTLDVLVLAGLSGLGFARMGCLANGCDFGRVTEVGWALRYPPGREAYAHHLMTQQIGWSAPWSLGVHPFSLYLVLGILGIVLIAGICLWKGASRPGRIAGWSGIAYLIWRFGVEWTRDPSTVLAVWGAFNIHHLLAVLGALACGYLLHLESRQHRARRHLRASV